MLTQAVKNKLISNSKLGYTHPEPYRRDSRVGTHRMMDEESIDEQVEKGGWDSLKLDDTTVDFFANNKDTICIGIARSQRGKPYAATMSKKVDIIGYCSISKKMVLDAFGKKRISAKMIEQAKGILTDVVCYSYSDEGTL